MFISKLGCPERKENNSLTSKCRFKTLKIDELCSLMEFRNRASSVLISFIPADLDKKYRNEIEMNKK